MNANLATGLLDSGDLAGAGKEIGLPRATVDTGHGFDETDDSYARRLRAALIGAEAAGALSQPAEADVSRREAIGVKTAAEAIEALQKIDPNTRVVSLVVSLLPAASLPAAPAEPTLRQDGPTIEEWMITGYKASDYPPHGYAPRSTPEEIAAAVAAQEAANAHIPHDNAQGNASAMPKDGAHEGTDKNDGKSAGNAGPGEKPAATLP